MDWGWVGVTIRLGIFHLMTYNFNFPFPHDSESRLALLFVITCHHHTKTDGETIESNISGRGEQRILNWKLSRSGRRRPNHELQLSCCATLDTSPSLSEPQEIQIPVICMLNHLINWATMKLAILSLCYSFLKTSLLNSVFHILSHSASVHIKKWDKTTW